MRKLLEKIKILESKEFVKKYPNKKLAVFRSVKRRLNPYNPLSYLFIILCVVSGIIMFGFVGIKDQVDFKNPFKWQ